MIGSKIVAAIGCLVSTSSMAYVLAGGAQAAADSPAADAEGRVANTLVNQTLNSSSSDLTRGVVLRSIRPQQWVALVPYPTPEITVHVEYAAATTRGSKDGVLTLLESCAKQVGIPAVTFAIASGVNKTSETVSMGQFITVVTKSRRQVKLPTVIEDFSTKIDERTRVWPSSCKEAITRAYRGYMLTYDGIAPGARFRAYFAAVRPPEPIRSMRVHFNYIVWDAQRDS